ncbi:penicillin-binding protein [Streptomyces albofaciens JCM 4342]|uniref:transglycosylase domain-containing protein n=1 Tax=Streptomyces albofaciens TaxID=66866 RepID=UPI00123A6640|nr:transglycosylase domain-containing protein [Streptomyces albofaciens]KAA6214091.1 penicillin-binding protein [Streptomyces albofaciens JCM 4342]
MKGSEQTGKRFVDYPRRGRSGWRRWLPSWRQQLGVSAVGAAGLAGLFAVVYAQVDIPDENAAARQEATVYYWADGSQMVTEGAVNRQNVSLGQVPDPVEHAVIAAENASFYSDSGVSLSGIARAAVNMAQGQDAQGGSTITQQYVKNTYLSQDQTLKRKVKEFFIALKLDNRKSKTEILQGYLNTSYFGRHSFGIQAAANAYYGIPAKDLDPSQGAALAALLKGAEQYDPALSEANHRRAVARWKWILDREVETGMMSREERARYTRFPEPRTPVTPTSQKGQTGYLVDAAKKYLKSRTGLTDRDLARGGYRIHTTFEKDRVARLAKAVEDEQRRGIDPKKRAADTHVEFGAASVRPRDGAVVALYGGPDATRHFANNADTAGVPAGSAFKPFVLAAALRDPAPESTETPEREAAAPADAPAPGVATVRGVVPPDLYEGLVTSAHPPFVAAGRRLGLEKVRDLAIEAGLHKASLARLERTFPLGTSTPSAIRLAGAYSLFGNDGSRTEPYSVTRVEHDGRPLPGLARPAPRRVLAPEAALVIKQALQAYAGKTLPPETAAKLPRGVWAGGTGPRDRMRSAWFIGNDGTGGGGLTTAVTVFRAEPGAPRLLPMEGVGGDPRFGNGIPPRIWAAYAGK